MAFQEGAGNVPQQAFVQWNDPQGNKLIALNRDGTIFASGAILGGTSIGGVNVLVISKSLQVVNSTTAQAITLTAAVTELYAVSLYMESTGTAAAGHTVEVTIGYTSPKGADTLTVALPLDVETVIMETYPLLSVGGTAITLSAAYAGGAVNDPYTISARLVQMP